MVTHGYHVWRKRCARRRLLVVGSKLLCYQRRLGANMMHVNLDGIDERVKQFLLAVTADPAGSVLELNGQPVAWVVPAGPSSSNGDEAWSETKNQRRCDLIDRKYAGSLTPPEAVEL